MENESVKKNLLFWMIEDYLESKNAGPAGIERWRARVTKSIRDLLEESGADEESGIRGFSRFCAQNEIFPGISGLQVVTADKMFFWVMNMIQDSYRKSLKEEDYDDLTTHGIVKAKAEFFCPGYTVALVKSQFEGEDRSEWVIEK